MLENILPESYPQNAEDEPSARGGMVRPPASLSQGGVVLTDDQIARARRLLDEEARWRIGPEDLPEVIASEQRHKHRLVLRLTAPNLDAEERTILVNGIASSDATLTEYHKLAHHYLRLARMPEPAKGKPTPDLGPRFDAARHCDLVDLIQTMTGQTAIRAGDRYKVRCPFHDDHEPSLVIYGPGRGWYCHVCHVGGSSLDFVMRLMHTSAVEALLWIEEHFDTWPESWHGKARA